MEGKSLYKYVLRAQNDNIRLSLRQLVEKGYDLHMKDRVLW